MQKSVFVKGTMFLLGLVGLASAQFKYWDPADTSKTPKLLSQTGLYVNLAVNKNMVAAAVPFEVNSALWSDGSHKKRWVLLKANTSITFSENKDYWTYPDGAVFVKNFAIDTVPGDTLTRLLWETRFLILKKEALDPGAPAKLSDMWYGFSYKWRRDQKEADLVADTGLKATLRWFPQGKNQPVALKKWIFPPRDKCLECHRTEESDTLHGRSVLGFFTAQLNMPSPITPGVNQLEDFFTKKVLIGTKPANWATAPRWYGIKEPLSATVTNEKKARAYIAANCSGCHGDRGMELGATFGVDLNYDYHTGTPHMKFEYKSTSWGYGLDTIAPLAVDPALVVPGYPEKSVILFRQRSRNQTPADDITAFDPDRNQMPPLASFEINEEAMAVISAWIKSIPPTIGVRGTVRQALLSPTIQGRNLILPPGMNHGNAAVSMTGINGRSFSLTKVGSGVYAIPASLPKGIYVIRVGSQNFTRYLF